MCHVYISRKGESEKGRSEFRWNLGRSMARMKTQGLMLPDLTIHTPHLP